MKKLGIFLIIVSILLFLIKREIENYDINYHNKVISKIYDNYNINKEYLGYIEIPKYNIKRLIKKGVSSEVLDKNYVGMMDTKDNLILLAGHNIKLVFRNIHYMKKDDLINLYLENKTAYKVIETKKIMINDYSILNNEYKEETLILMTCTHDSNKRFVVIAKRIKNG
ncbi:MAG: sortase [Lactobacillales bacterium]|nr:sortase [Lactobacillales bacterium]